MLTPEKYVLLYINTPIILLFFRERHGHKNDVGGLASDKKSWLRRIVFLIFIFLVLVNRAKKTLCRRKYNVQ